VKVVRASPEEIPRIRALLQACTLSAEDVDGEGAQRFLVARENGEIVGCIGLEVHGEAGLLRSFAVAPASRRRGVGALLHEAAVGLARELGVQELYLLTTTVRERALRGGFEEVAREDVPASIREGSQFRGMCPATAACLHRRVS
jgi:amino-acid N-acetyltransferase